MPKLRYEIHEYSQKARELREQATECSNMGGQILVWFEVQQLLDQAKQFQILADQKDVLSRLEAICLIDNLEREASD
ncbi:hypothetical protein [Brevibacillus laterosporus]|uniref:hypothetical protein n=1 Tax=Brevibacillus laterosporus TaxID=1465 RepID=UPI0011B0B85B|nr:hypothetical protein [Brevibacillus laterosporus]